MENTITLDAWHPNVKKDILELPERLLEGMEEGALAVAHLVLAYAIWRVRVDTGSLRDSGRVERGGKGKHKRIVRVRFGGYVVNPDTGKLVDYAAYVEAKYPFLKPAWADARSQAEAIIRRKCLDEVARMESAQV